MKCPLGRGQLKSLLALGKAGQLTPRVKLDDAARALHVLVRAVILELRAFEDEPSTSEPLLVLWTHLVEVTHLLAGLCTCVCVC